MNFLIFGPEKPKLSFEQKTERGTVVRCDNKYVLQHYAPDKPITWKNITFPLDLAPMLINGERDRKWEEVWRSVIKELKILCQTDSERTFLDKITAAQKDRHRMDFKEKEGLREGDAQARERFFETLLDYPALIPQAWVNWIHYDPKDKQRAKTIHLEPFRVDFLYQGKNVLGVLKKIIVEIDDISHIADVKKYADDFLKSPGVEVEPSLEKFTEHLRKDRWLRRHGWKVSRFSTLEAEKENRDYLYCEMLSIGGLEILRPPPIYLPHQE